MYCNTFHCLQIYIMQSTNILLVGLGGALGSMARYAISATFGHAPDAIWATFFVNTLGSLAIGALSGMMASLGASAGTIRAFAVVGVCGGFTTFSTFSNETFRLLQSRRMALAGTYALGSLLAGLAAVALGWWLTK